MAVRSGLSPVLAHGFEACFALEDGFYGCCVETYESSSHHRALLGYASRLCPTSLQNVVFNQPVELFDEVTFCLEEFTMLKSSSFSSSRIRGYDWLGTNSFNSFDVAFGVVAYVS